MKKKPVLKSVLKYLRELSVVVVGIAITFTLSDMISNRKEQKGVQRYLDAIKTELQENLPVVQRQFEYYDRLRELATYLQSDKPELLRRDSLDTYYLTMVMTQGLSYRTSAFEMFKASGAMSRLEDKELLKSIIDSYLALEGSKDADDKHASLKSSVLTDAALKYGYLDDIRDPKFRNVFYFFMNNSLTEQNFQYCAEQIETTLLMFPQ